MKNRFVISKDGQIRFIYDDRFASLHQQLEGQVEDKRASHVDPDPDNPGHFLVDLTPVGGPVFRADPSTGKPFAVRGDALAFEVEWLQKNNLA